jgi:hypothetical protein
MAYKQIGIMKLAGAFWSTYDCTFQGEGRSINVNWKGQGVFFGTGVANLVGGWTVDPNTLPRQIWFHTFAESKAGGAMVIEFRKKGTTQILGTFAGPLAGMGIVVLKGNVNVKKK